MKIVRADGGLESQGAFEEKSQKRVINLFALPPCSPRLNSAVGQVHQTRTEEFYKVTGSFHGAAEGTPWKGNYVSLII
ncbi:hypothetical protein ACFLYC_01120 [Chloroflexota bacterium]